MSEHNHNEEETIEVVTFTDDEGKEFDMEIVEEFEHNGRKFAVLAGIEEDEEGCSCCDCGCDHDHDDDEECDCETNVYIMQVVVNEAEDTEEFVSPAEEDMDALIQIVQSRLEEGDCCCDDDCCCDECTDDCTCDDSCAGDNASAKCGTCCKTEE